jgi:hypothetical protein
MEMLRRPEKLKELSKLSLMLAAFIAAYYLPVERLGIGGPTAEALFMLREYAREHVILCLVPAFFIAGAIANFVSQNAVIKYFGAKTNKFLAYSVASVSGTILAVCSCTVLPIFAGIHKRGAGIGPASTFLYSGPAINVLAIILTARVLGSRMGAARAAGAVLFAVLIGLAMQFIFGRKDAGDADKSSEIKVPPVCCDATATAGQSTKEIAEINTGRPLWKTSVFFAMLVGILIFANWGRAETPAVWLLIYNLKWFITAALAICLAFILIKWFPSDELKDWVYSSWGFAKQIFPLLFAGVVVAGFLLGRPGHPALIPESWIQNLVGGNGFGANVFASVAGALMYFATLTEVPILQGLMGSGMGKGPALALLLAGPALSLPNMLVLRGLLGTKKTLAYISLVIIAATSAGFVYGRFF